MTASTIRSAAQIAVAALGVCAMTGRDVIPTAAITVTAALAGAAGFVILLGRK